MKGNSIVKITETRGVRLEGIIDDTSKPGTCMEIVPNSGTGPDQLHFRARSRAAGSSGPVMVLVEDYLQGKTWKDAYVVGSRCFLYAPLAGDDLNVLLGDVAGTGDIVTQGDLFGINNNGKIIANASYTSAPFQSMETLPALTADTPIYCKFLGGGA